MCLVCTGLNLGTILLYCIFILYFWDILISCENSTSDENVFLPDLLENLKRSLQNFEKIFKKCFVTTRRIFISYSFATYDTDILGDDLNLHYR